MNEVSGFALEWIEISWHVACRQRDCVSGFALEWIEICNICFYSWTIKSPASSRSR